MGIKVTTNGTSVGEPSLPYLATLVGLSGFVPLLVREYGGGINDSANRKCIDLLTGMEAIYHVSKLQPLIGKRVVLENTEEKRQ